MARGRKPKPKSIDQFKRANGTGCIKKLSGNRRKPYIVLITSGYEYDEITFKNKQIQKSIGTYKTREAADLALAEYNQNPYDIDSRSVTFGEIYNIWSKRKFKKLAAHTVISYNSASRYLNPIMDVPVIKLKTAQLQDVIDECDHSFATKNNIRTLMNGVFTYCMKNDIVTKNYVDYLEIEFSDPIVDRIPFSDKEIKYLWDNSENDSCKVLLMLLYTGMRVNELLKLPRSLCYIEQGFLHVPENLAKNKPSVRDVPIHPDVLPFFRIFYDRSKEYLMVKNSGVRIMYNNFVARDLAKINKNLEVNHKFHDTRHTFISKAHEVKMDELCLKKIVGHTAKDITSKVYTHISLKELKNEIKKIKY